MTMQNPSDPYGFGLLGSPKPNMMGSRPAPFGFMPMASGGASNSPDPTAAVGAGTPPGMPMLPPSMSKAGKALAFGGAPAPSMPFGSLSQMLSAFKNPFANADYSGYQAGGYDPGIGSMS